MSNNTCRVALIDDHALFRKGLAELINQFEGYEIVSEAGNGKEFISQINASELPDIAIIDIAMPEMNGYETVEWLQVHHPGVKTLALSMYDNENSIIKMLRLGARGYLLKEVEPEELQLALNELKDKGFYYSRTVGHLLISNLSSPEKPVRPVINQREEEFLILSCSELTYKEIADKMCVSARTIDGYREALFEKLRVKNRVGLVLYAIRSGLFQVN